MGIAGFIPSISGSQDNARQFVDAAYKNNSCVICHANVNEPLKVSVKYYDWHMTRHQEKGVSCDKCHGGDPASTDKLKAHAGVLVSTDAQSRLSRNNQAATCGACHQSVANAFVQSAHYQKLKSVGLGPSCNTCHQHMATKVIYAPDETANLCSSCHNTTNFLTPRPEIPHRAGEIMVSLQRANSVIDWAALLLAEGGRRGISLTGEQNDFKIAEQSLKDAKEKWHTFDLQQTDRNLENAYQKGVKVKEGLRKRLFAD
jgi:hypothetical protein